MGARSHALAEHAKRRLGLPAAFDRPTLREFVVRTGRPAREVIDGCKRLGVHPGYAIGRDYDGLDDALGLQTRHQAGHLCFTYANVVLSASVP